MTETKDRAPSEPARNANAPGKPLAPEAQRALAEAAARRAERERATPQPTEEIAGRGGLDPVRYGDWEVKGVASDF
jgi:hypothetical protein